MKVIRSSLIGYCQGVSSTVEAAEHCIAEAKRLGLNSYSIGELIHNPIAVSHFEDRGLKVINKPEDAEPGVALIRAHGLPDNEIEHFQKRGFTLIDSTCRNILFTKNEMRKAYAEGISVIVLGVKGHAETQCLTGVCLDGVKIPVRLVISAGEAEEVCHILDSEVPVTVFVQTTFPQEIYESIMGILESHFANLKKGNSLCGACLARKKYALELAQDCDAVVVVGGKNSQNTKGLAEGIEALGKPVFVLENIDDLNKEKFEGFKTVGVCSGTSTPKFVVDDVCDVLCTIDN